MYTLSQASAQGLTLYVGSSVLLGIVNGFVLMVDSAFNSLSEAEIECIAEEEPIYKKLEILLRKREKIIAVITQIAEIVPLVGGGILKSVMNLSPLGHFEAIGAEVISTLIFIQIATIMKSYGLKFSKEVAVNAVVPLKIIGFFVAPITICIETIGHKIVGDLDRQKYIHESIIRQDIKEAGDLDIIGQTELKFITRAFKFSEKKVFDVMTFMTNLFAIDESTIYTLPEFIRIFESAHSRVPLVGRKGMVIECRGYILTKELLLGIVAVSSELPEQFTIPQLIELVGKCGNCKPITIYRAVNINENESITTVWKAFTTKQISEKSSNYSSMAIVSHGPSNMWTGVITFTDILQELCGNPLYDEDDEEVHSTDEINSELEQKIVA